MKQAEIHDMSDDQLFSKGQEVRETLFRLRFKLALGNTDTVRQLRAARKDLARIKTELRAREVAAEAEAGTHRGPRRSREERTKRTARRLRGEARAAARG